MPLEEEEDGQIVSLGNSRIERVRGCLAILKPLVCGFENVLHDVAIPI